METVGNCQNSGHQLGVRVARDALAVDLLAEVQQLLLADAAFQVGARVHARRAVALDVEQVAAVASLSACQKWLKPVPNIVATEAKRRCGRPGRRRRRGAGGWP